MKKAMYKKYANQKPIAVTHISNTLGIQRPLPIRVKIKTKEVVKNERNNVKEM